MDSPTPSARAALFSLEQIGIKLGLEQIRALLEALGRPDRAYPSIIVAGTNGKGSVTAMVERGLRAAGYRTGRYTSPHLVDIEERFAIDGESIAGAAFDAAAARVMTAATRLPAPPSFFEATTALGLDVFQREHVDIAVLEVGLGGRLDATNAVTPIAVVITAVDFDHEHFLGDTLEAIAGEKAGVIKPGALVVLSENPPVVDAVVASACGGMRARLVRSGDDARSEVEMTEGRARLTLTTPRRVYEPMTLALAGRHQVQNALSAVRLLEELSTLGQEIPETAIRLAVEDVTWPARLERIRTQSGEILIDGAHNPAGARALASYVRDTYGRRLPMVVGVMGDKKIEAIITALAPAASEFVFTAPDTPRAARPADLLAAAAALAPEVPATICDRPLDAVAEASRRGSPVVVAGSLYLAGEVRAGLS